MRHFRIKETIKDENKEFIIQYTKWFLFIKYWKKYNKIPYKKYEDALLEVKRVLEPEKDYSKKKKNKTIKYHYIDAFRSSRNIVKIKKEKTNRDERKRYNKSIFIPKDITTDKTEK